MKRIGIVGLGWVGSSVAGSVLQHGLASELLLNDIRPELAEGEALDFAHAALLYPAARVRAAGLDELRSTDALVISAGRGGRPGESRLALAQENARVVRQIAAGLRGYAGVAIMVSNPVDLLTEVFRRAADLPPERVFGTGTSLDSVRLRYELSCELRIHSQSIHAQVLGEHGDSELVNWSAAHCGGRPLRTWPGWSAERETRIAERVRTAAYQIIRRKGATNHAIGMVTASVLAAVLNDERRLLTVSRWQDGSAGFRDVPLSLPTLVGATGADPVIEPRLDAAEAALLARSAELLRAKLAELG